MLEICSCTVGFEWMLGQRITQLELFSWSSDQSFYWCKINICIIIIVCNTECDFQYTYTCILLSICMYLASSLLGKTLMKIMLKRLIFKGTPTWRENITSLSLSSLLYCPCMFQNKCPTYVPWPIINLAQKHQIQLFTTRPDIFNIGFSLVDGLFTGKQGLCLMWLYSPEAQVDFVDNQIGLKTPNLAGHHLAWPLQ